MQGVGRYVWCWEIRRVCDICRVLGDMKGK